MPDRVRSAEAAQRDAAAAVLRRRHKTIATKLKGIKDTSKLDKLLAELDDAAPPPVIVPPAPAIPAQDAPTTAPATVPAPSLPAEPATKAGWPKETAIVQAVPTAQAVWTVAAVFLAGSRYDLSGSVEIEIGGRKLVANKLDALVDATAPLIAKYLPDVDTPEARAGLVLAAVFVPPAVGQIADFLKGKQKNAGGLRAVPPAATNA